MRDRVADRLDRDDADGWTIRWDYGQWPGKKAEWAVELNVAESQQ